MDYRMIKVSEDHYASENGETLCRERLFAGKWVFRNADGKVIDAELDINLILDLYEIEIV